MNTHLLKTGRSKQCLARGSSLMAVFWMIAVLGMITFAAVKLLKADTSNARLFRDRMFAKRYAEMGLEIGRHPRMELYDPLLAGSGENGGSYQVNITTEEARFNINTLLLASDRAIIKRIFTSWGLKPDYTASLIDALKDWVDADSNVSLNGAEKRNYEKQGLKDVPFNRPFKDLDEMLLVRGMEGISDARPDWREWFTVHGDGRIDVNEARSEFVAVLANVPMERLQQFDRFRAGPDGGRRTMDDGKIGSAVQLAQMLGVFQPKIVQELQQWVQFNGPIKRIESIGRFNELSRKIVLVTQNNQTLWRGEVPQ
ncbi:MAG: general secretion pathway protein GspK [Verrucomicrobiaceae bacterium]|nr:general secretion pathway protein GspK [Verrucomicrobiaceae bacterium]